MKVQLGLLAADFAVNQELVGGHVGVSQGPCRMCSCTGRAQNNGFETRSTCSDYDACSDYDGSQLP